jgi:hypothetical protein
MPAAPTTPRDRVRRILIEDWDPHDVVNRPHAHGTYDAWIDPLLALLATAPTEDAVIAWLHERECETMCFPSLGTERLRRPAQRLLATQGLSRLTTDHRQLTIDRRLQ